MSAIAMYKKFKNFNDVMWFKTTWFGKLTEHNKQDRFMFLISYTTLKLT